MRFLVLLVVLAGCPSSSKDAVLNGDFSADAGIGEMNPAPLAPCSQDSDCSLAGATCCACPSFAVAASDPGLKTCSSITCPMMDCPTNIRAACVQDICQVACAAQTCATSCPSGFAADASGCLTCACLEPAPDACTKDTDCVEVPIDCCGCAQGGGDFAILTTQAQAYESGLNCPASPACPNQNACIPDASPRCSQGSCTLDTTHPLPGNACGRPDLMACPAGQVCVVNTDPDATDLGVGVCTPQ